MDYPTYEDVQNARQQLSNLAYAHWIHDDLFKWNWWLQLVLSIVPYIIWWFLLDKRRGIEILLYGAIIAILAIILDNIGTDLLWWEYPDKLVQVVPPLFPADIVLVPVWMMLVYQIFSGSSKLFLIANIILGAFLAFVCEPVFIWMNIYKLYSWNLTYSFLFYIVSSVLARWIVMTMKVRQRQYR
ncbi:CBO0543 family protein [Paenibacillus cremeus]|uniref:Uncharacterized protein n=1 Tax=Paenibacillus cremeus TaxID=2163881 RepID=A0A559K0D7_9BACL|nr:CBO0543 family protein [Paenibacillus cremeus]TVY05593.1 hypothetical protein FPZ49_29360 [Paenibacillus cremeus]